MPKGIKRRAVKTGAAAPRDGGFINMPVSKKTREGLHTLKEAFDVNSQADVVQKLVDIGLAILHSSRKK